MAIKCFSISSSAPTKVQNGIKRRRGTLPPLMLRPFENLLAMRAATTLQGRITEQRDGGIWKEVWEPSSNTSFHLNLLNASLAVEILQPSLVFPSLTSAVLLLLFCLQMSKCRGPTADMVGLSGESRERDIHSSRGSEVQSRQRV